jgi:hypothetical protein
VFIVAVELGANSVHIAEKEDGQASDSDDICLSLRSWLSCIIRFIMGRVSLLEKEFRLVKNLIRA